VVRPGVWLLSLLPLPGAAAAFDLILPVDCTLGDSCYIQQGFDHDPGPGTRDFACGRLTYDGHDGTDFALPTIAAMEAGVPVRAAAPGTVRGIRDGEPDVAQGTPGAPDVNNRECGNGVAITHPDGWETQYCHLRQGSIRVAPGDIVQAGTVLGQIGLSGQTEFPHLHLTVRQHGIEVDPFAPTAQTCGATGDNLWSAPIAMPPGGVADAGWATVVPDYAQVRAGTAAEVISRDSPALVLFGLLFGGVPGDSVSITIDGPEGRIIDHAEPLDRAQAILFRAAGLRTPPGGWPAGLYMGRIALVREGVEIDSRQLVMAMN
jgi:Peptidase family M23